MLETNHSFPDHSPDSRPSRMQPAAMANPSQLPDCIYQSPPRLIRPAAATPTETLYLSNLDDQKFLRFSIKYLYLFRKYVEAETLGASLSQALVEFYPLAGRLRRRMGDDDRKLEVECNGEGAVFAEAAMDLSCDEFLEFASKPNKSIMRKLLYRVEAGFLDIPPLVIQVTNLRCGGMILCVAITHCVCDGIGSSQFLHAWAHLHKFPSLKLPISPYHSRHLLKSRCPPQITFSHPGFTKTTPADTFNPQTAPNIFNLLNSSSHPLVPSCLTFTPSQILHLKRHFYPSLKCTTFEILASHTWRSWVRSLGLPPSFHVKLLFSVNVRNKMRPELPQGYYGNGFVLACAAATVKDLDDLHQGVKLVQHAKSTVGDEYVRSMIDLLDDGNAATDLSASLVISQWSKLGLEEVDFGGGKPVHMGPLCSDIYCLFLPVAGEMDAVKVLVSMPQRVVDKFEFYMTEFDGIMAENGEANNQYEVEKFKMVSV